MPETDQVTDILSCAPISNISTLFCCRDVCPGGQAILGADGSGEYPWGSQLGSVQGWIAKPQPQPQPEKI